MLRHALAIASEPDAQAEITVVTPALAPSSSPMTAAGAVGHELLDHERGHRAQALGPHGVVGEQQFFRRAHPGADGHRQASGVDLRGAGVLPRPAADHRGHPLQIRHPAELDFVELALEILQQMPTDANRQVVLLDERILERADPGLPVEELLPGVLGVGRERGRHGDASDDHVGKTVTGCQLSPSVEALSRCPSAGPQ